MKRAVILHGTDGSPEVNWFPWLREKLESAGYAVWVPTLPGNHAPDSDVYNEFLLNGEWDLADNVIVGHSSGAVAVLNLLMDERCPQIQAAVLVSVWEHGAPNGNWEKGQFAKLFPADGFDYAAIQAKCPIFTMLQARDDPYCPFEQAEHVASELNAEFTVLPEDSHLGGDHPEFPEVWEAVEKP